MNRNGVCVSDLEQAPLRERKTNGGQYRNIDTDHIISNTLVDVGKQYLNTTQVKNERDREREKERERELSLIHI